MSIRVRLTNRSSVAHPKNYALSYDPATFTYADLLASAWSNVPPTVLKSITGTPPKPKPKVDIKATRPAALTCLFVDSGCFPPKTLEVTNWSDSVLSSFSNGSSVEVRWRWNGGGGAEQKQKAKPKKQANKQGKKKEPSPSTDEYLPPEDPQPTSTSNSSSSKRTSGRSRNLVDYAKIEAEAQALQAPAPSRTKKTTTSSSKPKPARPQPGVSTSNRSGSAKMSQMSGEVLEMCRPSRHSTLF